MDTSPYVPRLYLDARGHCVGNVNGSNLKSLFEPKSKHHLKWTGDGFELDLSVLTCSLGQADDVNITLKNWDWVWDIGEMTHGSCLEQRKITIKTTESF
jgi:hypothetical protein